MAEVPNAPSPSGPIDALGQAAANAPDAAMQGLNRAMEQVQAMVQAMTQAFGQNQAVLVPEMTDAVSHLPEVMV